MGGSSSPANIKYRNPMQPQVQQPIGGFLGMGQQGLPSGMMQHIQQLQQQMPPMQPQKPVSAARQYLDAWKQYQQGGSQGPRPTYAQFKQQQQQANQVLGLNNQLQAMGKPGMLGVSPNQMQQQIQQYQQGSGAFGAAPQPMTQPPQQGGGMEMGQMFGGMSQQQMLARQQQAGAGGQPPSYGSPSILYGQPPAGGFGAAPQPMTQPPAGGFGAAPPPPPPPALGMAMGGSVGMAPPNPYSQQIGQEDPRMQAMRYMQQMNFGG
jgi:hypothetical protein